MVFLEMFGKHFCGSVSLSDKTSAFISSGHNEVDKYQYVPIHEGIVPTVCTSNYYRFRTGHVFQNVAENPTLKI